MPSFLAAVSWAGRRWGPAAAGWFAGLPVVGGPILLLLALERGPQFAAHAAVASLAGVVASLSFAVAYSWACLRHRWPAAVACGLAAWCIAAAALACLPGTLWASTGAALFGLVAARRSLPRPATLPVSPRLPRSELALRMAAGAALTLAVTFTAARIGPTWSGLLTVFPLLGVVLAVFSHIFNGSAFVVALFRAMASGMYGFAAFCLCLALTVADFGLLLAFSASLACALGAQAVVLAAFRTRRVRG